MCSHGSESAWEKEIGQLSNCVHDGDIVLVKACEEVANARKGIVWYNGHCYCKKIVQGPKGILLVSLNTRYDPISVTSLEDYHLFGEVVDVVERSQ